MYGKTSVGRDNGKELRMIDNVEFLLEAWWERKEEISVESLTLESIWFTCICPIAAVHSISVPVPHLKSSTGEPPVETSNFPVEVQLFCSC